MRCVVLLLLIASAPSASGAIERKPLGEVSSQQLVRETQQVSSEDNQITLVWWVPVEFWKATILRTSPKSTYIAGQYDKAFKDLVMIGVVNGQLKPPDATAFDARDAVAARVRAYYVDDKGVSRELAPALTPPGDAKAIIEGTKPMLKSMLGDMGANFHLLLFNKNTAEQRLEVSPYARGLVRVTLAGTETQKERAFEFEAPLNSLFVPRLCPNGKPADVSWKVCPWDGSKLAE